MTLSARLFSALVICGTLVPAIANGAPFSGTHVFDGEDGAPGLTSISPAGATAGHAALVLTVNGSGFVSGSTIEWNGAGLSTIFVSSSQLQALIPMSDLSTAGTFSITVVNPSPGGSSQNAQTFTVGPAASAPYFTLAGGTYQSSQVLRLTDTTPGAVIHYTYTPAGSAPTTGSAVYDDGITINHSGLVEAIALAPGYSQSPISSKAYVYAPEPATAAPYFSLAGGTYDIPQTLWLSDSTPGAVTYYTTDGSSPSAASTPYTGPITVSSTELVQAVAMATGYRPSPVSAKAYKFTTQPVASSPYFMLPGGTYSAPQALMLTSSIPGAKIYYTTDGSSPADDGILYTGPISISCSELVMAVTVAPGYRSSPASAKLYTFVPGP
jgi:hypothetical protein